MPPSSQHDDFNRSVAPHVTNTAPRHFQEERIISNSKTRTVLTDALDGPRFSDRSIVRGQLMGKITNRHPWRDDKPYTKQHKSIGESSTEELVPRFHSVKASRVKAVPSHTLRSTEGLADQRVPTSPAKLQPIAVLDHHDPYDDVAYVFGRATEQNIIQSDVPLHTLLARKSSELPVQEQAILHRMVEASDWLALRSCLCAMKEQRTSVPDDLLIQAKTSSTILHSVSWKAPCDVALLLLDILTMNEDFRSVRTQSRTKQFLLCGDDDGNTPLHLACANIRCAHLDDDYTKYTSVCVDAIDFTVIKNLLLLAPEALSTVNNAGDTPLHLLVASDAFSSHNHDSNAATAVAEEAIASLLHMAGHSAMIQNNNGCTLLHIGIACRLHDNVLKQLIRMLPEALITTDQHGMLPVHYVAAFGGSSYKSAKRIVDACPESICCQTLNGDTPLHLLVKNANRYYYQLGRPHHRTRKMVELLLGTGDEKIPPLLVKNFESFTPLHCCVVYEAPIQFTSILMRPAKKDVAKIAAVVVSRKGATPLHLAIDAVSISLVQNSDALKEHTKATVAALATSEACTVLDSKNRTPLMLAVASKNPSLSVLKSLLIILPDSPIASSLDKSVALHFACRNRNIYPCIIELLIKSFPEGASCLTRRRNTPLHEAAKHLNDTNILDLLIDACPEALQCVNEKGERPVDRAYTWGANKKVIALLERATCRYEFSVKSGHTETV